MTTNSEPIDLTKKICLCTFTTIFIVILFILSPLSYMFKTSLFMKIVALIILGYTIYLSIFQTNILKTTYGSSDYPELISQLNMNIILVCLQNFQEYILHNIEQLIKLNHNNIIVITSENLINFFDSIKDKITLISTKELTDSYNFYSNTHLDKNFRGGFWTLTSERFFYIYE